MKITKEEWLNQLRKLGVEAKPKEKTENPNHWLWSNKSLKRIEKEKGKLKKEKSK